MNCIILEKGKKKKSNRREKPDTCIICMSTWTWTREILLLLPGFHVLNSCFYFSNKEKNY